MASSAIKSEEEKKEYFDSEEELEYKINKLVKYIRKSKCFVGFTGAGISTSCGIPDFRSGYNTVLQTGPGAWEVLKENRPTKKIKTVRITEAVPSKTHMAFVALLNQGIMKHIISQNVDGLHRKSGVVSEDISELHGNIYIEKCTQCHKEYLRDVDVVTSDCATNHSTGNRCDNSACNGELVDNIINFGEKLNSNVINKAFEFGEKADLMLAMGSSLRVTPAATIPKIFAKNKKRLFIVNLQKTPLDVYAKVVIHAFCDVVMEKLMQKLSLPVPEFRLVRFIKVTRTQDSVVVEGVDYDDSPYSFIKSVRFYCGENKHKVRKAPFIFVFDHAENLSMVVSFQAHYGEPHLRLKVPERESFEKLRLEYNPFCRQWAIQSV